MNLLFSSNIFADVVAKDFTHQILHLSVGSSNDGLLCWENMGPLMWSLIHKSSLVLCVMAALREIFNGRAQMNAESKLVG